MFPHYRKYALCRNPNVKIYFCNSIYDILFWVVFLFSLKRTFSKVRVYNLFANFGAFSVIKTNYWIYLLLDSTQVATLNSKYFLVLYRSWYPLNQLQFISEISSQNWYLIYAQFIFTNFTNEYDVRDITIEPLIRFIACNGTKDGP